MPEPKSMLQATAEANNLAAVSSAKALYVRSMEEICGGDSPFMNTESLEKEHSRCSGDAIQQFKNTRKMGGVEMSLMYLEKLDDEMAVCFIILNFFINLLFLGTISIFYTSKQ